MEIVMKLLQTAAMAAALAASAGAANATTLTIGLQEAGVNGGAITVQGSTTNAALAIATDYDNFSPVTVSASRGAAPGRLFSNTIDTYANTNATLNVYISEQGVTSPSGKVNFFSAFTANVVPVGWTVVESTYLDNANGLFTVSPADLLATATFTSAGTSNESNYNLTAVGPYSVTELYTITATSEFSANNTIDLTSTVPEPGTLAILGAGLVGLGFIRRRGNTRV
jgi:hypothetical protein